MNGSTDTRDVRNIARSHRRVTETRDDGRVLTEESFWIEPGPGAGGYVLGGEMNTASVDDLAKLTPPPGAIDVTLDLSEITSFEAGAIAAILELAARIDRVLVIARPSRAVDAVLSNEGIGDPRVVIVRG